MSEIRLSERMSDTTHAVGDAQDALQSAITKAINTHFDAGIEFERERIVKLLEAHSINYRAMGEGDEADYIDLLIGIIIGSQK